MDTNLKGYINTYDRWLERNLISYSSKVVPIGESLDNVKHIIPSQQALHILKKARLITVANCVCRDHYKNCDNPLEVCFLLNKTGEKWVKKNLSRKINNAFIVANAQADANLLQENMKICKWSIILNAATDVGYASPHALKMLLPWS